MIRRPPRSPPFPYTTFFRSRAGGDRTRRGALGRRLPPAADISPVARRGRRVGRRGPVADQGSARARRRSEEHTSELQSRQYLVCRLLLEKKKHNNVVHSCIR